MDKKALIQSITPELYETLKKAVETGKWANGLKLTEAQKQNALGLVIAWDHAHKEETERVGYIHTEKHEHCGADSREEWHPIKFET